MKIQRLIFPDKGHCEVEEIQLDEQLGPNQVLIKTKVTLISAGTELAMFTRTHRGFDEPNFGYAKYPFKPGYLSVGEVVASNGSIKPGTLMNSWSPHATYAKESIDNLVPLPEGTDPEHATFVGLAGVAMTSIRMAPVRAGSNVVVIGMGIVGNLCAQLYAITGAGIVAGADLSEKRLAKAAACGVEKGFCTANKPLVECVKELGPRGAEWVIEAVGNSRTISDALKAVAERGKVVLLGSPRTKMEIDPYFDIHVKGISIIGAHAKNVADTKRADAFLLMDWIRSGKLRVAPLITQRMKFTEALKGFEGLRDKTDEYLGVILTF